MERQYIDLMSNSGALAWLATALICLTRRAMDLLCNSVQQCRKEWLSYSIGQIEKRSNGRAKAGQEELCQGTGWL